MGSSYGGKAANVTGALPGTVNIASSTATNPIIITTSSAHGLLDQTYVDIEGHLVNTIANGVTIATVLSSNTFSIPIAGSSAGGATGTVQSLQAGASATILGDGDSGSAANFNNPNIANLDRGAFFAKNLGAYKLAGLATSNPNFSDGNSPYAQNTGVFNAYVAATPLGGGTPAVTFTGAQTGDVVIVTYGLTVFCPTTGSPVNSFVALMSTFVPLGGSPGTYNKILGSNQQANPTGTFMAMTLKGKILIGGPSAFGSGLSVVPGFFCNGATGPGGTFSLSGDAYFEAQIWRPTLMPQ